MLETYRILFGRRKTAGASRSRLNRRTTDAIAGKGVRQEFAAALRYLASQGFFAGQLGEASLRLPGNHLLTIRPDRPLSLLEPADLQAIAMTPDGPEGAWPLHLPWHQLLYEQHPATRAVILSQPEAALQLANDGRLPDPAALRDGPAQCASIILAEPDAPDFAARLRQGVGILLPGYGLLTHGETLAAAVSRTEIIARWAALSR